MADGTVTVKGVRELIRAADQAGKATKKQVRDRLRQVAEPVRSSAAARLAKYDLKSASRLGISVRKSGTVTVEQRLRRTTGQRPNFGSLQMQQALIPALNVNAARIEHDLMAAVDDVADIFERSS